MAFTIIKTNIILLKDLKDKECELYRYEIQKDLDRVFLITGKTVKTLRYKYRDHIIFQDKNIIYSELDIKDLIKKELSSNNIIIKNEEIEEFKINLTLNKSFKKIEIRDLFLRYIGEIIALSLKSREEKILVFREYGRNNVFQATITEQHKLFGKIKVLKGFRYKPILLKGDIAIILEPKARYFTELNLRDILNQIRNNIDYDRSLVKLCPVLDCQHNFKPFTICDHGNPRSFGKLSEIFLDFGQSPSSNVLNLIEYYKKEEHCPTKYFPEIIKDEPPILNKTFESNVKDMYSYPIELIKIVPITEDAGYKRRELAIEVRPSPSERFKRVEFFKEYLICFRKRSFPIIPLDIIDLNKKYLEYVEFTYPEYLLRNNVPTKNPLEDHPKLGLFKPNLNLKFYIIYSGKKSDYENYLRPLFDKNKSPNYLKFSNLNSIEHEFVRLNNSQKIQNLIKFNGKLKIFFILVYGDKFQEKLSNLRRKLYQKNIPNQSIKIKTLEKQGYSPFTKSLF